MAGIDAKYVLELPSAEEEEPVEAFASRAADPALGVRVRVGAWTGVRITVVPSLWRTWPKPRPNFASRSWNEETCGCRKLDFGGLALAA
jgi:hypothetical protein